MISTLPLLGTGLTTVNDTVTFPVAPTVGVSTRNWASEGGRVLAEMAIFVDFEASTALAPFFEVTVTSVVSSLAEGEFLRPAILNDRSGKVF